MSGWRARVVEARVWLCVFRLALARTRDPLGAWRTLGQIGRAARGARRGLRLRRFVRVAGGYAWDLYQPSFPSRAFDGLVAREIESLETGSPSAPHTAIFAITRRCGLRCAHCFEGKVLNLPEGLTSEGLRSALDALLRLGVSQVFFSGGEPLARFDDLVALVRQAGSGVHCWVISAGPGLDRERARQLKRAGLVGLVLSLDSWDPGSHDRFRGRPGAFEAARRAALSAREEGLALALGLCPTREFTTTENLEAYRRLAVELGAAFIQVIEPKPEGRFEGRDVLLDAPRRALLEDFYERLSFGRAPNPIVSYPDLFSRRVGCHGGGKRSLYIDTEGVAHPCPFCREPAGSLVTEDPGSVLSRLRARACPEDSGRPRDLRDRACSVGPGGGREPLPASQTSRDRPVPADDVWQTSFRPIL